MDRGEEAALDALQGDLSKHRPVVIHDDRSVVSLEARKWYAAQGEDPGVTIEVWELEV
jgi:hypothetical protein